MSSQHKNAFRGEHITAVYTGVFKACKATRNNIWSVTIEKPIVKFHYFDCEFNLRFFCFVLWLYKTVCLRSNQRWVPNETRASGFGRATFNLAGFPVTHSDRETLFLLAH